MNPFKRNSMVLSLLLVIAMMVALYPGISVSLADESEPPASTTKEVSISFSDGVFESVGCTAKFNSKQPFEGYITTHDGVTGLNLRNDDPVVLTVTDPDFLTDDPVQATIVVNYYEYGDYNPDNNDMYIRCSTVRSPYYGDSGKIPPGTTGLQTVTYAPDDALFNHNLFSNDHSGSDFMFYQRGRQILLLDVTITYSVEDTGGTPTDPPETVRIDRTSAPYEGANGDTKGAWRDMNSSKFPFFAFSPNSGWYSDLWQWMYNNTANLNEYMEFTFAGTSVSVDFLSSLETGIAKIYVDGVLEETLDTYENIPTTDNKIITFSKEGLSEDWHTVKVEVAGKNPVITVWAGIIIKGFEYTPCEAPPMPGTDKLIQVTSPIYYSDIHENEITIEFSALGLTNAKAESLHAPDSENNHPYGYMKTVADNITLDSQGTGSFTFDAADFPYGPIAIHIMAWNDEGDSDDCYLQLFNYVGTVWDGGPGNTTDKVPAAIEGMGMAEVFFDDFTEMPAITYTGNGDAKYAAAKPDPDGWPEYSDAKFAPPGYSYGSVVDNYNPFAIKDGQYMKIETKYWGTVIEPNWGQKFTTGFLSSMGQDGSGFTTKPGTAQYFETRLFLPPNPGLWPAFWTLTKDDPDGKPGHDELDVLEAYMGGVPDTITFNHHTWGDGYVSIHDGGSAKTYNFGNGIDLAEGWHTYGMLITEDMTYYYFDDQYIPGSAHETLERSWSAGSYFMVNNAYRQKDADQFPGGFQRYGNTSQMYVDWVRVFQVENTGFTPLNSKMQVTPGEDVRLEIMRGDDVKGLSGTYDIDIPEGWTIKSGGTFGTGSNKDSIVLSVPEDFSNFTGTISITPVSGATSYDTMQISFTTMGLYKTEAYLSYDSLKGEYDLNVKLFNLSSNAMDNVEFTAHGPEGWTQSKTIPTINANGNGVVSFPIGVLDLYDLTNYSVDIKLLEDYTITLNRLVSGLVAPKTEIPITIDGVNRPEEWLAATTLEINAPGETGSSGWNGPDDLSALVQTQWDDDYLYLKVEVTDDIHNMTANRIVDAWWGDSLQISIDPARSSGIVTSGKHLSYTAALNSSTGAFGIAVDRCDYEELGQSPGQMLTQSLSSITRDETNKKTTYKLALAWSEILPEAYQGTTDIGIALVINDDEGGGREGWIRYMDGIATGKDPAKFGDLILSGVPEDPEPEPTNHTIKLIMAGNGISSPINAIDLCVEEGADITVTFIPQSGYQVDKVIVDGAEVTVSENSYTFSTVDSNHDIVVHFKQISTFTIKSSSGKNGSISGNGNVTVTEGEDAVFTFIPDEGYEVHDVKIDGKKVEVNDDHYTFENVTKNHTIDVSFKKTHKPKEKNK